MSIRIESRYRRAIGTFLFFAPIVVVVLVAASFGAKSTQSIIWLTLVNVLAVLGFHVYNGLTGRFSVGHSAFMAVAAYTTGILTANPMLKKLTLKSLPPELAQTELALPLSFLIALVITGVVAWLIGFAIVRLSDFGVIMASFAVLVSSQTIITGASGWTGGLAMPGIPRSVGPVWIGTVVLAVMLLVFLLHQSRWGLKLKAFRDDELAAKSMGVNTRNINHLAWILSAMIMGAAGFLMAHIVGSVAPRNFYLVYVLQVIAMLVLGGMKSASGAIVGTVLLSGVIVLVRNLESGITLAGVEFPQMFGAVQLVMTTLILAVMYARPEGIMGLKEFRLPGRWFNTAGTPPPQDPGGKDALREIFHSENTRALKLKGLSRRFGGLIALDKADFTVEPGKIVGLIGPNGAGKSTLVNTVMGAFYATEGQILLGDKDVTTASANDLALAGIGRTFQNIKLFPTLTVLENVMVALACRGEPESSLEASAHVFLDAVGLSEHASRYATELAYGDQRHLEIGRALALRPDFLLLDEPAAGMNHTETEALKNWLVDIRARTGVGILIIEHDLPLIMGISDSVVVLNRGVQIAKGSPEDVRNDPAVIEAYIGTEVDENLRAL